MQARLLEDVRSHREVREPVATGVGAVRPDTADLGSEMEHEVGVGVGEHPRRVVHRREVVVGASRRDDVVSVGLQSLDEMRAEKAPASSDQSPHPGKATSDC